jgi:heat shock protein HslJ
MVMRRALLGVLTLPLAFGLAACQASSDGPTNTTLPTTSGTVGGGSPTAALLGEWQMVSLQKTGAHVVSPPARHTFSADFTSDGRVHMTADCNRCFAEYTAAPGTLEVGPAGCTLAYCVTAPLDVEFAGLVSAARSWSVAADTLTLSSEGGTLVLRR